MQYIWQNFYLWLVRMWKNPLMLLIFIRPEVAINEYPSSFYVYFVNCTFFPLWMPPPFCNTSAWLRINASLSHSTCLVLVMAPSFVPIRLLCLILCITLSWLCICCTFTHLQFILLTCLTALRGLIAACDVFMVWPCWWSAVKVVLQQPQWN